MFERAMFTILVCTMAACGMLAELLPGIKAMSGIRNAWYVQWLGFDAYGGAAWATAFLWLSPVAALWVVPAGLLWAGGRGGGGTGRRRVAGWGAGGGILLFASHRLPVELPWGWVKFVLPLGMAAAAVLFVYLPWLSSAPERTKVRVTLGLFVCLAISLVGDPARRTLKRLLGPKPSMNLGGSDVRAVDPKEVGEFTGITGAGGAGS